MWGWAIFGLLAGGVVTETQAPPAALLPGGALRQTVVGGDTRQQVSNTTAYPYRAIVKVLVRFPKLKAGTYVQGTGTMIGPETVLTAGHVLYDRTRGGWATAVTVVPGASGGRTPYGVVAGRKWLVPASFVSTGRSAADLGAIKLAKPVGLTTGTLGVASSAKPGLSVTLAGYALDLNGALGKTAGKLGAVSGGLVQYALDTNVGASGSALYTAAHKIVAIHTLGGAGTNYGVVLTPAWLAQIKQWRATITSVATPKLVTVTQRWPLWGKLGPAGSRGAAVLGRVLRVSRTYLAANGHRYLSVYDGANRFSGFINAGAVRTVTKVALRRLVTVTAASFTRWGNLYWTRKLGGTAAWRGHQVYAATRVTLGNGRSYYSLYTRAGGTWLGYVNAAAVRG